MNSHTDNEPHHTNSNPQVWHEHAHESRLWRTPCAPTIRRIMTNTRHDTEKMLNHELINHCDNSTAVRSPGVLSPSPYIDLNK